VCFQLAPLSVEAAGGFSASNISLPFLSLTLDAGTQSEIDHFTGKSEDDRGWDTNDA